MKKLIAILMALILLMPCAFPLAEEAPVRCGGWMLPEKTELTEDALDAFQKATENLDNIEPIALLGTQVVAGINYAILVRVTYDTEAYYAVQTIYADLTGGATLMEETIIPLGIQPKEEAYDGQNPVMNFIGTYMDEVGQRAVLNIQAVGEAQEKQALITLHWANTAADGVEYTFTCEFNEDDMTFTYDEGVKKTYTATEEGEITYEIAAEHLTGAFTVQEGDVILWNAEGEDADNGCRFVFAD